MGPHTPGGPSTLRRYNGALIQQAVQSAYFRNIPPSSLPPGNL
jgi:hypothetical protein